MSRLINMMLRGSTLVSKFLLIFFLARFVPPAEVGMYGLVVATIAYALYLLGFDFYTYATREILKHERRHWGGLLFNQGVLFAILYVVVLPALLLLFASGVLPWQVAGWFFVILVLEHLTQELSRLLVAVSQPLAASFVLFFRSGLWAIAVIALMALAPELRQLWLVFAAWALGGVMALLLGIYHLKSLGIRQWRTRIDWGWIRRGIKVAFPLLIGTLAIRAVFTLDRYWFEHLNSLELLAAYVLFIGMCNALMSFLDAGVFVFSYPALIRANNDRDRAAFLLGMKRLLQQTLALCLLFCVGGLVVLEPLMHWLNKAVYSQHQGLFYWLLAATVLYAVGMVPHYGLYAQGQDKPIIRSHIAGLMVFVPAVWLVSNWSVYLAVPIGLLSAFLLILIWKCLAFYRCNASEAGLRLFGAPVAKLS